MRAKKMKQEKESRSFFSEKLVPYFWAMKPQKEKKKKLQGPFRENTFPSPSKSYDRRFSPRVIKA